MSRVVVIGCGGVAQVAIAKCCQLDNIFTELCIASRTISKCVVLKEKLQPTTKTKITTRKIDANNLDEVVALFDEYKPELVIHCGMPYHNLVIMDACIKCKVHYIDTAAYEPENVLEEEWRKV
jgi:saccharopine dehydrogenase (NAD+, L-lysine-forming)